MHTIRVETDGDSNSASSGFEIIIDAFEIRSASSTLTSNHLIINTTEMTEETVPGRGNTVPASWTLIDDRNTARIQTRREVLKPLL
jgi:hypothetical protein